MGVEYRTDRDRNVRDTAVRVTLGQEKRNASFGRYW